MPSSLNFLPQFAIASEKRRYIEWESKIVSICEEQECSAGPVRAMGCVCGLELAHNVLTFIIWNKIIRL